MKRIGVAVLLVMAAVAEISAQRIDDSLRYQESIWSMKKKALVLEAMALSEAEKSSFWPVYESYSNAIQFLDLEYIRLLGFAQDNTLSEKKSAELVENLLTNDLQLAKVRKQYYRKFRKALTANLAGRFMQLDDDFRTSLRNEMTKESPALVSRQPQSFDIN